MNEQPRFVIPFFDRKNTWQAFTTLFVMIIVLSSLLISFETFQVFQGPNCGFFVHFLRIFTKGLLYLGIGLLAVGLISFFFFMRNKGPLAILDPKGIWIYDVGFIPWDNIATVTLCSYPAGSKLEYVGIQLRDVSTARAQASWSGKSRFFWAKIFGYHHIMLSNAAVSNDEIIYFARLYKDAHDRSQCRSDALARQDITS